MTTRALAEEAAQYILSIRPSPYVFWYAGEISRYDGPPAWAVNEPAPDASYVQSQGGFCVSVASLMQRYCGVQIPNPYGDEAWDGGTLSTYNAYFDDSYWFRAGVEYDDFYLLCSPWVAGVTQGHVGVVYQGYVIEWIVNPGLVWLYSPVESNAWGQYELAVPPEVWLGLEADTGAPPVAPPVAPPRDADLAAAIDPYLGGHGSAIVKAARDRGLDLALGCALVETESGGQNIFGCDFGDTGDNPPYCQQEVTYERVQALRGGGSYPYGYNGVGLTQLTWWTLVDEAEALGGAHLPENQCSVGFRVLADYIEQYNWDEAIGAYNAGEGNRWLGVSNGYAQRVTDKYYSWKGYLERVTGGEPPPVEEDELVLGKYNFCAVDQPARTLANALQLVLEEHDVACLVLNDPENIRLAAREALETSDASVENAIVIGDDAFVVLTEEQQKAAGWQSETVIWYSPQPSELDQVNFALRWVLWYIARYAEGDLDSDELETDFRRVLTSLDSKYKDLLDRLSDDDQLPPPPPGEYVELEVPLKNTKQDDLVKVRRAKEDE